MVHYMLDTNIASYIIKGNAPAVYRKLNRIPISQLFISAVTEGELRYGVERLPGATKLQQIVEEFLRRVTILPWDSDAAKNYGHLRSDLERSGQPLDNLDLMIAAHALATGSILVTSDRAFTRVKKLKIENWTV
jgi:tRNA(fMet)-specific endonuclease VapC